MKKLLTAMILMTLFIGCGSDKDDHGTVQQPVATPDSDGYIYNSKQYKSGACGQVVIDDYHAAFDKCQYMNTINDIAACKTKLTQFRSKYPGINCDTYNTSITISFLNDSIKEITDLYKTPLFQISL